MHHIRKEEARQGEVRTRLLAALGALFTAAPALAAAPLRVAVADFDYLDTSGEARDQRAAHDQRLHALSAEIGAALAHSGRFTPERLTCAAPPCSADSMDQDAMTQAARAQHAQLLVFGGVHKMSTLIEWARIEVMDVATGQRRLARTVTFRGDTDDAWQHAADYIGQMLVDQLHA
jgi:hypothetical protein